MSAVILLPALLLFAFYRERKGNPVPQIWYMASGLMLMTAVAATLALVTGDMGEEIVEKVVAGSIIEEHERWGKLFAFLIYVITLLSVIHFFVKDPLKKIARTGLLVLSILLPVAGAQTGRLGGELVYKHNAASALMMEQGNAEKTLVSKNITGKYNHDRDDDDQGRDYKGRDREDDDHERDHKDRDDD